MNIEIITSRNAKLKETGFGSLLACDNVLESLEKMGHSVLLTICETLTDLEDVVKRKPSLVILATKYMPIMDQDNVWFSQYFEDNNIEFSGSNRETLKYDSDKVLAKERLMGIGIKTAKHFTAVPNQYITEDQLPFSFPLFIKPGDAANGNGIDDASFVESFFEFQNKVLSLYGIYEQPVLVEEYLGGKEFTVAVIKSHSGELIVSAIEIIPPMSFGGLRILGSDVKKNDSEALQEIEYLELESVMKIAAASFRGLGARGFGRIDVKMDSSGCCYFMEANLVPGMNYGTSYFPKACEIANEMSYDDVIKSMLNESIGRANISLELTKMHLFGDDKEISETSHI
jgi:D-alanine-D-alanine ligase